MNTKTASPQLNIPYPIIKEADNLSKETGIPFRVCLELLYQNGKEPLGKKNKKEE